MNVTRTQDCFTRDWAWAPVCLMVVIGLFAYIVTTMIRRKITSDAKEERLSMGKEEEGTNLIAGDEGEEQEEDEQMERNKDVGLGVVFVITVVYLVVFLALTIVGATCGSRIK